MLEIEFVMIIEDEWLLQVNFGAVLNEGDRRFDMVSCCQSFLFLYHVM